MSIFFGLAQKLDRFFPYLKLNLLHSGIKKDSREYIAGALQKTLGFFIFVIVILFGLFFFFGIIGPKRWRGFVKDFYKWFEHDRREVIFPIDPNKPLIQATKEGLKEIPDRIKAGGWLPWNWSHVKGSYVAFILFQLVVLIGILIVFWD